MVAPHNWQNLAVSGFGLPHCVQNIRVAFAMQLYFSAAQSQQQFPPHSSPLPCSRDTINTFVHCAALHEEQQEEIQSEF
jgi:hypothetical protein